MTLVLLGGVAYLPWWLSLLLALTMMWQFDSGYELLFPTMLADLAFGTPLTNLFNFAFPATLLLAFIITFSKLLLKQLFLRSY